MGIVKAIAGGMSSDAGSNTGDEPAESGSPESEPNADDHVYKPSLAPMAGQPSASSGGTMPRSGWPSVTSAWSNVLAQWHQMGGETRPLIEFLDTWHALAGDHNGPPGGVFDTPSTIMPDLQGSGETHWGRGNPLNSMSNIVPAGGLAPSRIDDRWKLVQEWHAAASGQMFVPGDWFGLKAAGGT